MNRSEDVKELVKALAAAQLQFGTIHKNLKNPYYGNKYADLAAIIDATQPALNKHGIVVLQSVRTKIAEEITEVETLLIHESGQYVQEILELPATMLGKDGKIRFDAQSCGGSQTYGRRYALQALIGVAAEADLEGEPTPVGSKAAADAVAKRKIDEARKGQPQQSQPQPTQQAARNSAAQTKPADTLKPLPADIPDMAPIEMVELFPCPAPYGNMYGLRGVQGINIIKANFPFGTGKLAKVVFSKDLKCFVLPSADVPAFVDCGRQCGVEVIQLTEAPVQGDAAEPDSSEEEANPDWPIIESVEKKLKAVPGKKDKVWFQVKTNIGEYTTFNATIANALDHCKGQRAHLEAEENTAPSTGKIYRNIKSIIQVGGRKYENNEPERTTDDIGKTSYY